MADEITFNPQASGVPPPPPPPDYRVPLIIAGVIGVGTVAYLSTRKKQEKSVK